MASRMANKAVEEFKQKHYLRTGDMLTNKQVKNQLRVNSEVLRGGTRRRRRSQQGTRRRQRGTR
jgi:hypothetical protein